MAVRPSRSKDDPNYAGCGIAVVILFVIGITTQCSEKPKSDEQVAATAFSNTTGSAIAAQEPVPVEPINRKSVAQARRDFRAVSASEGPSGAMIYSQNCFEGLTHKFAWDRVDVCGAFDLLAVDHLSQGGEAASSETAYFESETAAGRYLAAVTSAGEEAERADLRLESLQQHVGKTNLTTPALKSLPNGSDPLPASNSDDESAENIAQI